MQEELSSLELLGHRIGIFGGYHVLGMSYQYTDSVIRAWHITSWPVDDSDLIHAYWVVGGKFLIVAVHSAYRMSNNTLIQTFGDAVDLKEKERQAILEAIKEWGKTREENLG
jgi:hypothetical protein